MITTHPLKITSLISICMLLLAQILWTVQFESPLKWMWMIALSFPLLIPIKGLWQDKRYTYKWVGFLTLLYFCIGVSESFVNDSSRLYSVITIMFSVLLFLSSIYYSRFLGMTAANTPHE